jgi:hypothetical protein
MIVQIGIYKFGATEIESFSFREGQKIVTQERIGAKPILQNNGPALWESDIGIRGSTQIVKDLENKIISLLALKREGKPVVYVQGENNWQKAMITDFNYSIEEMDVKGRPLVMSCDITLKEYVTK